MEETDLLINQDYNKTKTNKYLIEIESHLKGLGISAIDTNYLVDKFITIIENDPTYLFHHDSHHWANYLAEISGLIRK